MSLTASPSHVRAALTAGRAADGATALTHPDFGGLQAQLLQLVAARLDVGQVGGALLDHGAHSSQAGAPHLVVRHVLQLLVRDRVCGLHGE